MLRKMDELEFNMRVSPFDIESNPPVKPPDIVSRVGLDPPSTGPVGIPVGRGLLGRGLP